MTTAVQLQNHIEALRKGLDKGVGSSTLDQLVSNVTDALIESLRNGDVITVAGTDTRLKTRLQTLSAINQGYKVDVAPGPPN